MKNFQCSDCRESYPFADRFTVIELPGKAFCEECFEERCEAYREETLYSNYYQTGIGQSEFFGAL